MVKGAEIDSVRTPRAHWVERWWAGEAGWRGQILSALLTPVEAAFRGIVRARGVAYDLGIFETIRVPVPVVSVGNISVGGAGKTPMTRWLVEEFRRRGHAPAVLHGGYAQDEPALHRSWNPEVPVLVGRDRVGSANRAIAAGASVLVLDDGFQHRRLGRDLDLVLVAAESWGESRRLLPRGPWRETTGALSRAHAVVVTRRTTSTEAAAALLDELSAHAPRAVAVQVHLRPSGWRRFVPGTDSVSTAGTTGATEAIEAIEATEAVPDDGEDVPIGPSGEALAVTAIARPEDFVANARSAGARVTDSVFYRDHHEFTTEDIEFIRRRAAGRSIITTAKDLVKLGPLGAGLTLWVLEQEVVVEEGATALAGLLDRFGPPGYIDRPGAFRPSSSRTGSR